MKPPALAASSGGSPRRAAPSRRGARARRAPPGAARKRAAGRDRDGGGSPAAAGGRAGGDRRRRRGRGRTRVGSPACRPARRRPARPGAQDHGRVDEAARDAAAGEARGPELVRTTRYRARGRVRGDRAVVAAARGHDDGAALGAHARVSPAHDPGRATRPWSTRPPSAFGRAAPRRAGGRASGTRRGSPGCARPTRLPPPPRRLGRSPLRPVVAGAGRQAHDPAPGSDAAGFGPRTTEEVPPPARRAGVGPFPSRPGSTVGGPTLRSRPAAFASQARRSALGGPPPANPPASCLLTPRSRRDRAEQLARDVVPARQPARRGRAARVLLRHPSLEPGRAGPVPGHPLVPRGPPGPRPIPSATPVPLPGGTPTSS
jgi:hypothetical protein